MSEFAEIARQVLAGCVGRQTLWRLEHEAVRRNDAKTREGIQKINEASTKRAWPDDHRWWLYCAWNEHRNTVEAMAPLLEKVREARGDPFMTGQNIVALLDAKDPEALVQEMVDATPTGRGGPRPLCEWEGCRKRAMSDHLYCARHIEKVRKQGLLVREDGGV